jgi:phosphomannomutase
MVVEKRIKESIFRRGDIRGRYPGELDRDIAYRIGRTIASMMKSKKFVMGIDKRESSKPLQKAVSNGLRDNGAEVIYLGEIDTPGVYFAANRFKCPGIMITASHNPMNENGIKIVDKNGFSIGEKYLAKIKKSVLNAGFGVRKNVGKEIEKNIFEIYKKHLIKFVDARELKKMNVVVNIENGVSEKFLSYLFRDLEGKINLIMVRGEKELSKEILRKKADFGVNFDTDGDRIICFDEKGEKIDNSLIGAMLIRNLKIKHGWIVYIVPCSRLVPDSVKISGLRTYRTKVGRTAVMQAMRKKKAVMGVELSGHYYFKDNFYSDSGYISLLKICEAYSIYGGRKISAITKEFDEYFRSGEISLRCANGDTIMKSIEKYFRGKDSAKIDHLDGLTVSMRTWWFNLRKSGTESLIRLNVEADDGEELDEKVREILKLLWKNGCRV